MPVADVDRAKAFYEERVGFEVDHDTQISDERRVVQLTPPGSACSIVIGTGLAEMEPGSLKGLQLTVRDMDAVRDGLIERGVEVSEVEVLGREGRPGFKHAHFSDPDGNVWVLQDPARLGLRDSVRRERWSDEVDEILGGDLAVGLAYLTPAKGVLITPMAPVGMRDREAGTVTLSSSLALWKKLDRMRRNPGVAVAYHAREHGFTDRPGFVLVQGRASFDATPDRAWLESITPQWDQFLGKRSTGLIGRTQRVYYWERIAINSPGRARGRLYRDTDATRSPRSSASERPPPPEPQKPPRKGTEPRVDVGKVASHVEQAAPHAARLVRVRRDAGGRPGLGRPSPRRRASASPSRPAPCRQGGRRAGLTSHWFKQRMVGQNQRIHSGWLMTDEEQEPLYAPHSRGGLRHARLEARST